MRSVVLCTLAVAILLSGRTSTFATAIIAVIEEKIITIAADSIVRGGALKPGGPTSQLWCKIRCMDRLCFAASGRYWNEALGYNLWTLADVELRRKQNPNEATGAFRKVIELIIPKVIAIAKNETPAEYLRWQNGRPIISYMFAGFENGVAAVFGSDVMLGKADTPLLIKESVQRGEASVIRIVPMGWNANIRNFVKANKNWAFDAKTNPPGFAERMILVEVQASAKDGRYDVGGPIAVVRLTPAGFFLEKNGDCVEK